MKGSGFEVGALRGQGCTNRASSESDISPSSYMYAPRWSLSSTSDKTTTDTIKPNKEKQKQRANKPNQRAVGRRPPAGTGTRYDTSRSDSRFARQPSPPPLLPPPFPRRTWWSSGGSVSVTSRELASGLTPANDIAVAELISTAFSNAADGSKPDVRF